MTEPHPEMPPHRLVRSNLTSDHCERCLRDWPCPAAILAGADQIERPSAQGFMQAWAKHENAPRTPCPICHFESSEGYPASHAPGCPVGGSS